MFLGKASKRLDKRGGMELSSFLILAIAHIIMVGSKD